MRVGFEVETAQDLIAFWLTLINYDARAERIVCLCRTKVGIRLIKQQYRSGIGIHICQQKKGLPQNPRPAEDKSSLRPLKKPITISPLS